jgi:hypothetical protein
MLDCIISIQVKFWDPIIWLKTYKMSQFSKFLDWKLKIWDLGCLKIIAMLFTICCVLGGKPSGPPKPLGKEQSHCSFCATVLRETATVQKDSCWTPLFSLCMESGKPGQRTWCSTLGLVAIATWQPITVHRSRETWGLPCTPSCFSILLKFFRK